MVAVARYMNVTLIVPELDKTSFWADPRSAVFALACELVVVCVLLCSGI